MRIVLIVIPPKINITKPDINLLYHDFVISCKDYSKYLAVTTDSNLNFKTNIQLIATKLSRSAGILDKL